MESNFPDSALEWVKHATWHGPVHVPWSRVDDDDIGSWAAAHQEEAVDRFAPEIARGGKHTEPSILVHQANAPMGVKSSSTVTTGPWRGTSSWASRSSPTSGPCRRGGCRRRSRPTPRSSIRARTRRTSRRRHPSSAPCTTRSASEGLWHTPDRHVSAPQQLPAYVQNTARALMRDQDMDESQAIATAINAVKEWAAGRAFGGHVTVTPMKCSRPHSGR